MKYFELVFLDVVNGQRQFTTAVISGNDYDDAWSKSGLSNDDKLRVFGIMQINPNML